MTRAFTPPPLPNHLVNNMVVINQILPSKGTSYKELSWRREFEQKDRDLEAVIAKFPRTITRDNVATLLRMPRRLFIASQIWGYGPQGVGPWRTNNILAQPGALQKIEALVKCAKKGDLKGAYTEGTNVKWLGPAFFTKLIYFAGLAGGLQPLPLILDTRVATNLEELGHQEGWPLSDFCSVGRRDDGTIAFVRPWLEGYLRYCNTINTWAQELGCPRADYLEYYLFRGLALGASNEDQPISGMLLLTKNRTVTPRQDRSQGTASESAKKNNQIRSKYDIHPFLKRYPSYDKNDFRMDIPPDCNCRKTMLKIGLGLKIIKDKGLLEEFKAYLKLSNRSIRASYEEVYQQHLKHTLPMHP